jgi:hypothetical protein
MIGIPRQFLGGASAVFRHDLIEPVFEAQNLLA